MNYFIISLLIILDLIPMPSGAKNYLENKAKSQIKISPKIEKQIDVKHFSNPIKIGDTTFDNGLANYSIDLSSGKQISAFNETKKLPVASLTKLMTAYIILKENNLEQFVTVPSLNNQLGDSVMGIEAGESLTIKNLVHGLLINSGSDAAQTLAVNNADSINQFVVKMNKSAKELGLENTHYTNPVGWDDTDNYSTAKDVQILAQILLRNPEFAKIVSTKTETVQTQSGRTINLQNTNKLLGTSNIYGVKTGYTPIAGECLATYYKSEDKDILTVILGSPDRFGQTTNYLDWILHTFSW